MIEKKLAYSVSIYLLFGKICDKNIVKQKQVNAYSHSSPKVNIAHLTDHDSG